MRSLFHMVPWPSGKARVCKTLIRQFKSGRYLQKRHTPFGVCLFWVRPDLNHQMQLSGGQLPATARRSRTIIFLSNRKKNVTNLAGTNLIIVFIAN